MNNDTTIPQHVALILDGNRRWASKNNVSFIEGYRKSYQGILEITRHLWKRGVRVVTIWGFSTENWKRGEAEVNPLMDLFLSMDSHVKEFVKSKVHVTHLGRKDRLPKNVMSTIEDCENATKQFDTFYLNIAIDYGGRDELVRAYNRHIKKHPGEECSEASLSHCLDTAEIPNPDPDIVIRTGGEKRLSGFMLWQVAYSEFVFIPDYLPDVKVSKIDEILEDYATRNRRFGA